MRFAGRRLAHFDAGLALAGRDELEVVGDEGRCSSTIHGTAAGPVIELRREDEARRERIEVEPANSYRLEAENMSAAIRGEAPPLLGRADAVGQARAIEALYEAAESGAAVTLVRPSVPARTPQRSRDRRASGSASRRASCPEAASAGRRPPRRRRS